VTRLSGVSGLSAEIDADGAIRRMAWGEVLINLFVGNGVESGPTNLYLRLHTRPSGNVVEYAPLLGPRSSTAPHARGDASTWSGEGTWQGLRYSIALKLSQTAAAWFWLVSVKNTSEVEQPIDLIYAQDIALAPYVAVRLNEYYVSQYVDHTPLKHETQGWVVASRQNQSIGGRNPWCVIGSLRCGHAFATDAIQVRGLTSRAGMAPAMAYSGLPSERLQHEHSMVAIQEQPLAIRPGADATFGFFGLLNRDHPDATSASDLEYENEALALPEAAFVPTVGGAGPIQDDPKGSVFSSAPLFAAAELSAAEIEALFPGARRHEEVDEENTLLSFFRGLDQHVVLRAKELRVQRPHGHLLRTGGRLTPDETALTSTAWMSGVFHSMLTQGHVSINRFLSTVHGYIGLFRSHGQRVFIDSSAGWQLLDVPSAFEMSPNAGRWIYHCEQSLIELRSEARSDPHELTLTMRVLAGPEVRCLISHHVALNGDDGSAMGPVLWSLEGSEILVRPSAGSELARRFPEGSFSIEAMADTVFECVGGDELLFLDGQSHQEPYLCVVTARSASMGLRLRGRLIERDVAPWTGNTLEELALPKIVPPSGTRLTEAVMRLADIVPWYTHDALIHYLSPRGLEQYSGGGWGTRDVTQGPVEMLLALGKVASVRDLILRVLSAQNPDGDWPQWFMFFERERGIRAGDSHGDIAFWPLLALSQYLIVSGDAALLSAQVPFFATDRARAEHATVWQHVERTLALIERRIIAGTALAAYGHGDWNDSLQPADPSMRESMCSAWTVTLHHQTLTTLACALRIVGRATDADRLEDAAAAVRRDFQQLLLIDGVLAGYALFATRENVNYLLHPRDETTGVHYSALAMIHAILEGMLTPAQARQHLRLIETHLSGPDGVRLFDRPLPYHGGPQRFFQRAESATFFGREIGLMYMHAHLRYAQALAYMGEAELFFHALCQANPIGIRATVPTASLRQANCYYSSSDAAFADRYQASADYDAIAKGTVALDGGWRVYSSGAGIALSLIIRRFLGLSCEFDWLSIDPVIPATLDGLKARTTLSNQDVEVTYEIRLPGHGVSAVLINGQLLPFARETNPYRTGAARVSTELIAKHLTRGSNAMTIRVGAE
jgi:cellobiose phosphorylase